MRREFGRFASGLLLLLLLWPQSAQAQLLLNFNPAGQSGTQGTTLTFNATLENIGTDPIFPVFLNGAEASLTGNGLMLDTSPFFQNAPLSLNSGETWTGDIFTVAIAPTALPGNYTGSFTVVGGPDDMTQNDLLTQNFQVTVLPATSVPAPGALVTALVGIMSATAEGLRRRRK